MVITGSYNGYPQLVDLDKITRLYVSDSGKISVCGLSGDTDYLLGTWKINGVVLEVRDVEQRKKIIEFIVNYLAVLK